jgi:hypothetical protein
MSESFLATMHRYSLLWAIAFSNAPLQVALLALCFLSTGVGGLPTQNLTIEVPNGTTNHGDPDLLCTPTTWIDITKFFMLNFFAHAFTVVSYPGESTADVMINVLGATLFPTSGAMRGINSIMRHSIFKSTDLQKAARSGALCMLVRSPTWKPQIVRMEHVPVEKDVVRENNVGEEKPEVGEEDIITEYAEEIVDIGEPENGHGVIGQEDVTWDGVVRDIWVVETPGQPLLR